MNTIRRIVIRHTAGPYPGLRQIVGLFSAEDAEEGRIPDILPAAGTANFIQLGPDGRKCRALRLRTNTKLVMYQEQA